MVYRRIHMYLLEVVQSTDIHWVSFYIIEFEIVQKTQIYFMDLSKSQKPAKMHGWLNYVRAVIDI